MNYRSAMIFGTAREVTDREEKLIALDALVEHVLRGRSSESRPANEKELRQTMVLDYALPLWAGVVPVRLAYGEPVVDERVSVETAASVINATTAARPRSSARTQSTAPGVRAGD